MQTKRLKKKRVERLQQSAYVEFGYLRPKVHAEIFMEFP